MSLIGATPPKWVGYVTDPSCTGKAGPPPHRSELHRQGRSATSQIRTAPQRLVSYQTDKSGLHHKGRSATSQIRTAPQRPVSYQTDRSELHRRGRSAASCRMPDAVFDGVFDGCFFSTECHRMLDGVSDEMHNGVYHTTHTSRYRQLKLYANAPGPSFRSSRGGSRPRRRDRELNKGHQL